MTLVNWLIMYYSGDTTNVMHDAGARERRCNARAWVPNLQLTRVLRCERGWYIARVQQHAAEPQLQRSHASIRAGQLIDGNDYPAILRDRT
jgi:hypothetical protein